MRKLDSVSVVATLLTGYGAYLMNDDMQEVLQAVDGRGIGKLRRQFALVQLT